MAEHNIDEIIKQGNHDLKLIRCITDPAQSVDIVKPGEPIAYNVLEGGIVEEDLGVNIKVEFSIPARLRGKVFEARLVHRPDRDLKSFLRSPFLGL